MNNKLFPIAAVAAAILLLGGILGFIQVSKNIAASRVVTEVTEKNFEAEVLKHNGPIYIEFYVDKGCEPCEKQAPIIEKVAADYKSKIKFVRVHALQNQNISAAAGISAVPTHILLNPAEGVGVAAEGFLTEAELRKFLDDGLAAKPKADPANGTGNGTAPPPPAPVTDPPKKDGN